MHATIADKKDELAELCRRYRVSRLEVFGSAARGADFDPDTSDADFLPARMVQPMQWFEAVVRCAPVSGIPDIIGTSPD